MTTLRELMATTNSLWPPEGAQSWDAVGLVSGNPSADVAKVHLVVDMTLATIDDAIASGADCLIAHHPLMLRGVTGVGEDTVKGAIVARAIRAGVALIAAHTNADVVEDGPTGVVMRKLGVRDTTPIDPLKDRPERGIGLVGSLSQPVTLRQFAERLAEILPPTVSGIRVAGDPDAEVRRVAMCSGAGDSLLERDAVQEADVYISGDLRHHPALDARERAALGGGPALIDTSHWACEWVWLDGAAAALREAHPDLAVEVPRMSTDPWRFAVGTHPEGCPDVQNCD